MLTRYRITPKIDADERKTKAPKKTRQFDATLLAYVEANDLWKAGEGDIKHHRPMLAFFAGTEQALRPFVANLRMGYVAESLDATQKSEKKSSGLEFLRSVPWSITWQHHPEASVARLMAPGFFEVDPGPRPDEAPVSFISLPSRAWVAEVTSRHLDEASVWAALEVSDERRSELPAHFPALAVHWAARLDTRLRWPLLPDPRFAARLLLAALDAKLARLTQHARSYTDDRRYREHGLDAVGLCAGVGTYGEPKDFGTLIAEHTRAFLGRTSGVRASDQTPLLANVG